MEFTTVERNVLDFIKKNELIRYGERILVSVSGGPDSVFLLHFLNQNKNELKCELVCCHINHKLRGVASEEDLKFVRNLSRDLDIPFLSKDIDVIGFKEKKGLSIEESARMLRYSTLRECAFKTGVQKIALGHTYEDSVETFFINLFRGSGRKGMIGIQPMKAELIRPLLCVSKREILTFLKKRDIDYRIDITNWHADYTRNFIRRDLVPFIEGKLQRNVKASISQLMRVIGDEEEVLIRLTEESFGNVCKKTEEGIVIDRTQFSNLETALQRRIVRKCFSKFSDESVSMNYKEVESLRTAINRSTSGVRLLYPPVLFLISTEKVLVKKVGGEFHPSKEMSLSIPGSVSFLGRFILQTSIIDKVNGAFDNPNCVYFDYEKVREPLIVRARVNGDSFIPFGLPYNKKVKELFIDEKVPFWERDSIPLVSDKEGILWVVGIRRSGRAKIEEGTKKILKIEKKIIE